MGARGLVDENSIQDTLEFCGISPSHGLTRTGSVLVHCQHGKCVPTRLGDLAQDTWVCPAKKKRRRSQVCADSGRREEKGEGEGERVRVRESERESE